MIKLGITGGIGSGKSVVARLLQVMDVPVYLTDDAAKRLMTDSPDIRRELSALAGAEVYRPDGSLNRALLAAYMFGHPDRVARVNAIVHPRVKADFLRWCGEQERRGFPLVGMECAILYESGFDSLVDRVLTVSAPVDIRLQRVMRRDAAREEQVRKRIAHQLDDSLLVSRADFVVTNDGFTPLLPRLYDILVSLRSHA